MVDTNIKEKVDLTEIFLKKIIRDDDLSNRSIWVSTWNHIKFIVEAWSMDADYAEDPRICSPPWLENEFHHLSLPPSKPALGDFCRLLPDPLENWLSPFVFAGEKANFLSPPSLAIDPDDWSFWFDNRVHHDSIEE